MRRTAWIIVVAAALSAACTTYFETPTSSTTTPEPPPDPNRFSGVIGRGGSASRTLALAAAGSIEATLTDLSPSVMVGMGIGLPRSDQAGCTVTRSLETFAGDSARLVIQADAGTYCVKVFDMGHIREDVVFTVTIAHP